MKRVDVRGWNEEECQEDDKRERVNACQKMMKGSGNACRIKDECQEDDLAGQEDNGTEDVATEALLGRITPNNDPDA
eukprot:903591-Rhodomonas_salina.1